MKAGALLLSLILATAASHAVAQPTFDACFQKPVTIILDSKDSTTNSELTVFLKTAKKNLAENDKIFLYVYSQGNWGTQGLQSVSESVENFAASLFSKKQYKIITGGFRNDASIDIFILEPKCRMAQFEYKGNPEMTISQVDFPDAPLGLSVFPKQNLEELVSKKTAGVCDSDWCGNSDGPIYVTFYVIVDRDGRVMSSWPVGKYADPDEDFSKEVLAIAKQTLANWAFKPFIKDGTPRFVRGYASVLVAGSEIIKILKFDRNLNIIEPKTDEKKKSDN